MNYLAYWWIPILALWYGIYGYASVKNNLEHNYSYWFWTNIFLGFCPLWAFVGKYSQSLVVDVFLYDIVLFFSFNSIVILGGGAKHFSTINWLGIVLITMGFVLVHLKN